MNKKEYVSPEFETIRVNIANRMMDASTEDVMHDGNGNVGDW